MFSMPFFSVIVDDGHPAQDPRICRNTTPEPLSKLNPEVPPALDVIIRKALRRYPENRYQSAAELLHDLDHIDAIVPSTFDLAPEPAMGGMAAVESTKRIWQLIAVVAVVFILVCALAIGLTVVLR